MKKGYLKFWGKKKTTKKQELSKDDTACWTHTFENLKHCANADADRCRNIVLTWMPTDTDINDWVTT